MLKSLDFSVSFIIGIVVAGLFGATFSSPAIWRKYFNSSESYLKAGEYGETDEVVTWSIFKEPINAWSSLAYSVFGVVILLTGFTDYSAADGAVPPVNNISIHPGYPILYGLSCLYLGIASFFFHASHAEVWRKADAGMTSGVMAAPAVFGVWDRTTPPGIHPIAMIACAVTLQMSFIHGYLPYGSSDILLPTLVAITWSLELLPAFGGPVSSNEYRFWAQCAYGALGGMFLRAADIKRNSSDAFSKILSVFFGVTLLVGWFLGFSDYVVIIGFISGALVWKSPAKGHMCWHFFSSFALFIWWYLLRTRPGNPSLFHLNKHLVNLTIIVFFVAIKNGVRRLFMNFEFMEDDLRSRLQFLLEHLFFTIWGWHVMVNVPTAEHSWLLHSVLCWKSPVFPFDAFHLFYQAKVATHTEDLIFAAVTIISERNRLQARKIAGAIPSKDEGDARSTANHTDFKMNLHHISTAILCIASYFTSYVKIGSIVMFLHDISDIPLDLVRIFSIFKMEQAQIVAFIATVLFWLYWRLWYFPTSVLLNIAYYSKSPVAEMNCEVGTCSWQQMPERFPFLLLLGSLQVLHVIWFYQLVKKGYEKLFGSADNKYRP